MSHNRRFANSPNTQFRLNTASPQALGLLAWWPTYGGGNTLLDRSGNGNDGTFPGGTADPAWVGSERGLVLSFDASDDYVDAGDIDFETTDTFTISIWIKQNVASPTVIYRLMTNLQGGSPFPGIWLAIRGDSGGDPFEFEIRGSGDGQAGGTFARPNDTEWHHVAVTYDGSTTAAGVKFYVDGIEESKVTTVDTLAGSSASFNNLYIGRGVAFGNTFNGLIDEVRLYTRTLSAAEVWTIYSPDTRWDLYAPARRVFVANVPAVAGDLSISASDSISLSESTGELLPWLLTSRADAISLAEAVDLLQEFNIPVADAVAIAETAVLLLRHQVSVSDAIAIAETALLTLAHQIDADDAITLADIASLLLEHQILTSDAISVADVAALLLRHQINVADALSVSDVVALLLEHRVSVGDAVGIAETVLTTLIHQIDAGDGISITDTVALLVRHQVDVSDAINITEAIVLLLAHQIPVSDAVTLTEATTVLLPELYRSFTDSLTVADDSTVLLTGPDLGISVEATNIEHLIVGVKISA